MTKNTRRYASGTHIACRCFYAIPVLLALLLLPRPGFAQPATSTVVHDFTDDVKQYPITRITDDQFVNDKTIAAGTIFTGSGNIVNLLVQGSTPGISYSLTYDDQNYVDERVVAIVGDGTVYPGTATYYIICLARPAAGNDRILIIPVNNVGTVTGTVQAIFPTSSGEDIYPLHAIYHTNGHIYICGYHTTGTSLPIEPDFSGYGSKDAFVIEYNPSGGGSIVSSITINTSYSPPVSSVPFPTNDYDIAMRLVPLSNGKLFVTGSVNAIVTAMPPGGGTPFNAYHSGTMNVQVNASLSSPVDNHFINNYGDDLIGDEYGVGLVEDNTECYVVGNYFNPNQNSGNAGFDPLPTFLWVTAIDDVTGSNTGNPLGLLFPTSTNMTRKTFSGFDYAWALQTLPSANGSSVTIAGLQTDDWCKSPSTGFFNNVRTFLHDIQLGYSPSSGITGNIVPGKWVSYNTLNGTGNWYSDANSYHNLGGGLSNVAWYPCFATNIGNYDVFTAPRMHNGSTNYLNLKTVKADATNTYGTYLQDPTCPGGYYVMPNETQMNACFASPATAWTDERVVYVGPGTGATNVVTTYGTLTLSTRATAANKLSINSSYGFTDAVCGSVYKPSGVQSLQDNSPVSISIYPNPAVNTIHLSVKSGVTENGNLRIEILNIQGQLVSTIYNGPAGPLMRGDAVALPGIASGLYLVKVWSGAKVVHQQKLSLQ